MFLPPSVSISLPSQGTISFISIPTLWFICNPTVYEYYQSLQRYNEENIIRSSSMWNRIPFCFSNVILIKLVATCKRVKEFCGYSIYIYAHFNSCLIFPTCWSIFNNWIELTFKENLKIIVLNGHPNIERWHQIQHIHGKKIWKR